MLEQSASIEGHMVLEQSASVEGHMVLEQSASVEGHMVLEQSASVEGHMVLQAKEKHTGFKVICPWLLHKTYLEGKNKQNTVGAPDTHCHIHLVLCKNLSNLLVNCRPIRLFKTVPEFHEQWHCVASLPTRAGRSHHVVDVGVEGS